MQHIGIYSSLGKFGLWASCVDAVRREEVGPVSRQCFPGGRNQVQGTRASASAAATTTAAMFLSQAAANRKQSREGALVVVVAPATANCYSFESETCHGGLALSSASPSSLRRCAVSDWRGRDVRVCAESDSGPLATWPPFSYRNVISPPARLIADDVCRPWPAKLAPLEKWPNVFGAASCVEID